MPGSTSTQASSVTSRAPGRRPGRRIEFPELHAPLIAREHRHDRAWPAPSDMRQVLEHLAVQSGRQCQSTSTRAPDAARRRARRAHSSVPACGYRTRIGSQSGWPDPRCATPDAGLVVPLDQQRSPSGAHQNPRARSSSSSATNSASPQATSAGSFGSGPTRTTSSRRRQGDHPDRALARVRDPASRRVEVRVDHGDGAASSRTTRHRTGPPRTGVTTTQTPPSSCRRRC